MGCKNIFFPLCNTICLWGLKSPLFDRKMLSLLDEKGLLSASQHVQFRGEKCPFLDRNTPFFRSKHERFGVCTLG